MPTLLPPRTTGGGNRAAGVLARVVLLGLSSVCLSGQAQRLAAQGSSAGSIVGVVRDGNGAALPNAEVSLPGVAVRSTSGSGGEFRLDGLVPGEHVLRARHIGYRTTELSVIVRAGEPVRVQLELAFDPVLIEGVRVDGLSEVPANLREFQHRRSRGGGHFLTRDEIGAMQVRDFTDVLRHVPGVRVVGSRTLFGAGEVIELGRASGGQRTCAVLYFLNGAPFPLSGSTSINAYVRPDDVAGVEVYHGSARVPARFNASTHGGARCGVVAIWTYAGNE